MKALLPSTLAVCFLMGGTLLNLEASEEGYISLLDAVHAADWKHAGAGEVQLDRGVARTSTPRKSSAGGVFWYEKKRFRDFSLRLEFRCDAEGSNAGVYVRIPNPEAGMKSIEREACEIDIYGNKTSTLVVPPEKLRPTESVTVQPGRWHELEVNVVGQRYSVTLDGKLANERTLNRGEEGFVGLQNWPGAGAVDFRNLRIKELEPAAAESVPAPAKANEQPLLSVLAEQAPNAIEWALAPLDEAVPADIGQNLLFMRENLLDEAGKNPQKPADAYKLGASLCSAILEVLEARRQARVKADFRATEASTRIMATSQALEARRNKMSWPQFAREEAQREEIRKNAGTKADVIKERPKLEWAERTTGIRRNLDAQYAQFRAAARQAD